MTKEEYARRMPILDAGRKNVDDKTASLAPEMFVHMTYEDRDPEEDIPLIEHGTRINWNGTLKRAAVDLWDTEDNNPDNAPTLWADLPYKDGIRIIPEVITVTTAFSNGELGWEGDELYRSKKDNNVYTPSVRPEDWEKVNE